MVDYDRSYQNAAAPAASTGSTARTRSPGVAGAPSARPASHDIAQRFDELAAKWRDHTQFHSSPKILFEHPAYQEIIGFGPAVLPLLFKDLEETGSFWFWALHAITNENPVPHEDRGDIPRVTEHWLNWGRKRGYLDG
ncbi:MAG TPA: hypothetical protein VGB24_20260 [Longimicrobium sp.]|jgi:hypothetical protein|uniref:hypothetical protein n=1 Tax=Longimicrobium sp. TaxID=2029185 RepID=UPI002ED78E96